MSSSPAAQETDWPGWLHRWDVQQEGYVPEREDRFSAMFDVLAAVLPGSFVAVDLASGPGSLGQRLLARFPGARAVAVDIDPVLVAIGKGALGTLDGRLRWVEADLEDPGWLKALGEDQVDAVLTTTAMHWLQPEALARVYRDLGRLIRPGGVFLNGDNLAYGPEMPTFQRASQERLDELWSEASFAARGIETAEEWWAAAAQESAFADLLAERTRRFAAKQRPDSPGYEGHVEALRDAGFREVGTVWQVLSNRVLLAVR